MRSITWLITCSVWWTGFNNESLVLFQWILISFHWTFIYDTQICNVWKVYNVKQEIKNLKCGKLEKQLLFTLNKKKKDELRSIMRFLKTHSDILWNILQPISSELVWCALRPAPFCFVFAVLLFAVLCCWYVVLLRWKLWCHNWDKRVFINIVSCNSTSCGMSYTPVYFISNDTITVVSGNIYYNIVCVCVLIYSGFWLNQ